MCAMAIGSNAMPYMSISAFLGDDSYDACSTGVEDCLG